MPFLGAAAVGQGYLLPRLIDPLEDIVRELTEEMEPVARLQMALFQVTMPVNEYLISGDPDARRQFAQRSQRVEQAFQEASPEQFTLEEERALIKSARAEWAQALQLSEPLLHVPAPVGNAAAGRDMKRFEARIDQAVSMLDEAHNHFYRVLNLNRVQARVARTRAQWVTLGAFILAGAVSLFAGIVLARSVTHPLNALRKGAASLAEGSLSHRVAIYRNDELGELAAAFNTMAGRLEVDQAALAALATRDGLTGLYNHRTFYTLLTDELARAQRFSRPVSLLLLDIDHFKRINDMHGHLAGDAVLKGLSNLLDRQARAIDRVCRYGGEEITVILPETGLAAAANLAERMRSAVEAQAFDANSQPIHITVSIGVASWPAQADSAQTLVAAADAAMYAAKQNGRNRVARYDPAQSQT